MISTKLPRYQIEIGPSGSLDVSQTTNGGGVKQDVAQEEIDKLVDQCQKDFSLAAQWQARYEEIRGALEVERDAHAVTKGRVQEVDRLRDHSVTVDADCQQAHSERRAAEARLQHAMELIDRLEVWADSYGKALVPHGGESDSYGDGARACKAQVKAMLAAHEYEVVTPEDAYTEGKGLRVFGLEKQLAAANALPGRIWEALNELTSYLVDGHHMVRVDDVRHT